MHCNCRDLASEVSGVEVVVGGEDKVGGSAVLDMVSENKRSLVPSGDVINQESEEDESLSLEGDRILDSSCSLFLNNSYHGPSGLSIFFLIPLEAHLDMPWPPSPTAANCCFSMATIVSSSDFSKQTAPDNAVFPASSLTLIAILQ